jgi:hypothetical protein
MKEVKFTGKEYLEYIKYQDAKQKKRSARVGAWLQNNKWFLLFVLLSLLVVGALIDALSPAKNPVVWTWEGI